MKAVEILSEISAPTSPPKPGSPEFNESLKYLRDIIAKIPASGSIKAYKTAIQTELTSKAKYIKPDAYKSGDLKTALASIGAADLMATNKPALDTKLTQLATAATDAWYAGRKEQFLNNAKSGGDIGSKAEQLLTQLVGVHPTDASFFPILMKTLVDPTGSGVRKIVSALQKAGIKSAP